MGGALLRGLRRLADMLSVLGLDSRPADDDLRGVACFGGMRQMLGSSWRRAMYSSSFAYYGPTIAVGANAERNGRGEEFDAALDAFCDKWNQAANGPAHFQKEYLLSVGTRR